MEILIVGTGTPVPSPHRAGSGIHARIADEEILFDCGPGTTAGLVEHDRPLAGIGTVFLSHAHVDHTVDFSNFVVSSWAWGRTELTVVGPPGTERLVDAMESVYGDEIAHRVDLGFPAAGIEEVQFISTDQQRAIETDTWDATALPVDHSIEANAYKLVEKRSGATFVYSGDTAYYEPLAEFAAGADLLVHEATVAPGTEAPANPGSLWSYIERSGLDERMDAHRETHASAEDAGRVAAMANVDQLVLTHILPFRDTAAMVDAAAEQYDGSIVVAEDGDTFSI